MKLASSWRLHATIINDETKLCLPLNLKKRGGPVIVKEAASLQTHSIISALPVAQ